ncbi:MAG: sugar transferase, partial [Actinomycetota bacterium]|nr:sugar transferase [Actinomycetota bacterium]
APRRPVRVLPGAAAPQVDRLVGVTWRRRYARYLVVADFAAASAAALLALLARFGADTSATYVAVSAAFPLLWTGVLAAGRAYDARFLGAGSEEFRRVFDSAVRTLAVVATVAYAANYELARGYVVLALPMATVLTLGARAVARTMLHKVRQHGMACHSVVVTGTERSVAELVRQVHREPRAGFRVVGACVDRVRGDTIEGVPVLGPARTVGAALRRTGADTVAVGAWSSFSQSDLRRLAWELEGSGVDIVVAPSLTDIAGPRLHIRPVAGLPLLHVEQPEFTGVRRVVKAAADRLAALSGLLVLLPALVVIAVLVRATSPGPALFRQTRIGVGGRPFTMYKFRSMRVTAEQELADLAAQNERAEGLLFKMRQDPRVTPLGGWLRRFSLDELPQLINVLKGDMSLVGPRPPLASEVEKYADDVRRRLLVKPGLTGLWQISGRSDLSWEESVRLDLYYVENWTPLLDVAIIAKTFLAVVSRRGAY